MTTANLRARVIRETAVLLLASAVLGLSYSFLFRKGFFALPQAAATITVKPVPPEFISFEEAHVLFNAKSALFVDARHDFDYRQGHIVGAINVPLKDFVLAKSALASIPKDRILVTYCDGAECNSSIELAKKLSEAGFVNVKMFFGGWNEWQQRHQQTEQ